MKLNFGHALKTAKHVVTANSPVLLLGTAIAGVVGTGILAAKGGYAARGIIDEAEEIEARELTSGEKFQLTWLCYAAPVLTGASTIAAATGVHYIHTRRFAALAGFYAVTSNKLDDYQEKAEEMLGAKKAQTLQDKVAEKTGERIGPPVDNEVIILEGGTELCLDEFSGRYFKGSVSIIENAVNSVNAQLLEEGYCSLNDFYDHIGLGPVPMGELLGWSCGQDHLKDFLSVRFANGKQLSADGRSAIAYWFHKQPETNYR